MALYIRITDNARAGGNFCIPLKVFVLNIEPLKTKADEEDEDSLWNWASAEDLREDGDKFEDHEDNTSYEIIEQG